MQRGVHFDPLRLPLLGGCVYGTSVRRRRGCRRWCRSVICPVVDSRRDNSTGTLGVLCVYSGVCCAVLCASTTLLLLRSVVRVRARAHTPSRDVCCACGRPCCVRCCHTVVVVLVGWHPRDKSAGDLSLYFTSPACASM